MRDLVLLLTARCNLACAYCWQAGREARSDMEWEVARRAIDLLTSSPASPALLALTGGEPLAARSLFRRCVEHARSRFPSPAALRILASTNGTLLDDDLVRFLARHDVTLQVSCDGAGQALRAPGTETAVDAGLRLLAATDPSWFRRRVRAALTLTPENLPLLADSVAWLLERGVPEIAVDAVPEARWPPGPEVEAELDRQLRRAATALRALEPAPRRPALSLLQAPPPRALPDEGAPWCRAGAPESVAVDPSGVAWGCPLAPSSMQRATPAGRAVSEALRLGDVREDLRPLLASLSDRARSVRALTHRRSKRSPIAGCGDCPHVETCSPCPLAAARGAGGDDPDVVPAVTCALSRASARVRKEAGLESRLWPLAGSSWLPAAPPQDRLPGLGGAP